MMAEIGNEWCRDLYEAEGATLLLYGRALGLSVVEAEDQVQETFQALLQMERPPEKPRHYLLRTFRNRALNQRRGLWRRLRREWESVRWFEMEAVSVEEEEAMRCLERLRRGQREVIVLKIWQGRTFEEIGALLEISPHTAAGRYRYGLETLRECLKKESYEKLRGRDREPAQCLASAPPAG